MFNLSGAKEWHDKGYKGKGIRVMVAEPNPTNYHAKSVAEIVKIYAPECEIIMYDYNDFNEVGMADFAIQNKVDIINTSYGINYPDNTFIETRAREQYKRICDAGILVVKSSGNEGENAIKDNGLMDERIINVGMVDKKLYLPIESAYDFKGTVDCCGIVGETLSDGTILWGTSEAAPYVAGLLATLLSKQKLSYKDVIGFIAKNSMDINAIGRDNETGYGVFRLPSFVNPLAVRMISPDSKTTFVHKDFVQIKIEEGYMV